MKKTSLALVLVVALPLSAAARSDPAPPEAKVDELAALRAAGSTRSLPTFESDKGEGDWQLDLVSGQCVWIVGIGNPSVGALSFYLWDPMNKKVAVEKPGTVQNVLAHCPEVSGSFHLRAKIDSGGRYRFGVYAKSSASAHDDPLAASVAKAAHDIAPEAKQEGEYFIGVEKQSDWSILMSGGRCYWIVGVAEKRTKMLDLFLWDTSNKKIAAVKTGQIKNMVVHCPAASGSYRLRMRVEAPGEYRVGVFAKKGKPGDFDVNGTPHE